MFQALLSLAEEQDRVKTLENEFSSPERQAPVAYSVFTSVHFDDLLQHCTHI